MGLLEEPRASWLRRFTQEDMAAASMRMALSAAGPLGALVAEFATQFIPRQRIDRLQEFVEELNERMAGYEEQFRERLAGSVPFAALAEEATLAAVRSPEQARRRDLAALLRNGLGRSDALLADDLSLLRLLGDLNESEILILMSYGNFRRTLGDQELHEFKLKHAGVFDLEPLMQGTGPEGRRRWAMYGYYVDKLVNRSLLADTDGTVKPGQLRKVKITPLGRMVLELIDRSASKDPFD